MHVIQGDSQPAEGQRGRLHDPASAGSYALAVLSVSITTALAAVVRELYPVPDLEVLYFLTVLLAAIRLGRGPSLLTAALSVVAYDFCFVPPFNTLAVADARYVLSFAMMFGVGIVVSELTSRLRRQEKEAVSREAQTAALYALSRDLAAVENPGRVAEAVARHAAHVFSARVFVLRAERDLLEVVAVAPQGAQLDPKELSVARWSFEHGQVAGLGTETLPESLTLCSPLRVSADSLGVLALEPRSREPLGVDQRAFLDAFCRQAAFAFERTRLSEVALASSLEASAEALRSSLLSAVSHDLRTPLAAITGAATTLRDGEALSPQTRAELLKSVCDEAQRMEQLVGNLLEMTRLESGEVTLERDWVPIEEVIGSALTRLEDRIGDRDVKVELEEELPLAFVDPVSFQQVFVNLFENSAKYTPAGSPLLVRAHRQANRFLIHIADNGPGFAQGDEERIFDKFFRGAHGKIPGAGLGLAICRAIVTAHGGSITARNREGTSGAEFLIDLPVHEGAPTLGDDEAKG